MVLATGGLHLMTLYMPALNQIFKTTPLTGGVGLAASVFVAVEIENGYGGPACCTARRPPHSTRRNLAAMRGAAVSTNKPIGSKPPRNKL